MPQRVVRVTDRPDFTPCVLGEQRELLRLDSRYSNALATERMMQQCQRSVVIYSHYLDPDMYDTAFCVSAITGLVRRTRHATVRIIVHHPQAIIQHGHRLLHLVSRLSDFVKIRVASEAHRFTTECYLLVDAVGYIHRENYDDLFSTADFNSPRQVRTYLKNFEKEWAESVIAPGFRRLHV